MTSQSCFQYGEKFAESLSVFRGQKNRIRVFCTWAEQMKTISVAVFITQYLWCLRVKLTNDPLLGILYTMPPRHNGDLHLNNSHNISMGPEPNDLIVCDDNAQPKQPLLRQNTLLEGCRCNFLTRYLFSYEKSYRKIRVRSEIVRPSECEFAARIVWFFYVQHIEIWIWIELVFNVLWKLFHCRFCY